MTSDDNLTWLDPPPLPQEIIDELDAVLAEPGYDDWYASLGSQDDLDPLFHTADPESTAARYDYSASDAARDRRVADWDDRQGVVSHPEVEDKQIDGLAGFVDDRQWNSYAGLTSWTWPVTGWYPTTPLVVSPHMASMVRQFWFDEPDPPSPRDRYRDRLERLYDLKFTDPLEVHLSQSDLWTPDSAYTIAPSGLWVPHASTPQVDQWVGKIISASCWTPQSGWVTADDVRAQSGFPVTTFASPERRERPGRGAFTLPPSGLPRWVVKVSVASFLPMSRSDGLQSARCLSRPSLVSVSLSPL
jgi:hypothetical protein